jgi:hypothetical protein
MRCPGIHCDGCNSGSGIGIIIAAIIGLLIFSTTAIASRIIHDIIIGVFILTGIVGLSIGIPVAIVIAITRRNHLVKFYPVNQPRAITTVKVIPSETPAIRPPIRVNAVITPINRPVGVVIEPFNHNQGEL